MPAPWRSHGTGRFAPEELGSIGERVVFEEGVLVGAGAVVKGEFPADVVVAGVPARVIR